jgi:hypothetical protein
MNVPLEVATASSGTWRRPAVRGWAVIGCDKCVAKPSKSLVILFDIPGE